MDRTRSKGKSDLMIICANPSAQFQSYQAEIEGAVKKVLRGNRYILGAEVSALEAEFARYIGVHDAIGVANGTDALELALRALDLKPGDEVITVSHTAVATVAAVEAAGAIPVLVDIDPEFFTLNSGQLEEVYSVRTRAVIAVHLYGQAADLDAIASFCRKYKLMLIEDCSQAHGAKWKDMRVGSVGDISCFSCYPTKNLGAIGDAGLVGTSNLELAQKIRMLREYGWRERYISELRGRNSRLDELQAAILRIKLRYLEDDNGRRRKHAARYTETLNRSIVEVPSIRSHSEHVFHLYVIKTKKRAELISALNSHDIYPGIHYPVPIHLQPAYKGKIRTASSMKNTEEMAHQVLSLPMYPELSPRDVDRVATVINASITK